MSKFFSMRHAALTPYTPGEQPRDQQYVKLNTNESPFPPCPAVVEAVKEEAGRLRLYPDPTCAELTALLAARYGVAPENVLLTNGSDEALYFAFMAFCDEERPIAFPDITYGFYPVYAQINHIPYETVPLRDDFSIAPTDYIGIGKNVILANPNAPTGMTVPPEAIERIAASNAGHVVIIDEAYVDFGAESAIPLTSRYDNLLVIQTFSKSRSMAGARLGFAIGNAALIADLNTIKYSTNPYNINRLTLAAGIAAIENDAYFMENCRVIAQNRAYLTDELRRRGFTVLDSRSNFVFAKHPAVDGERLYLELKRRGVLVRHFTAERIRDFVRITVGSREQLDTLLHETDAITEG